MNYSNKNCIYPNTLNWLQRHIFCSAASNFTTKRTINFKRYMMGASGSGAGRGLSGFVKKCFPALADKISAENQISRDYVSYATAVRTASAVKVKPHPGLAKIEPDGKNILHIVDHSGQNHYLLVDLDSAINSDTIRVLGTFTTSPSPYNGKSPTLVTFLRLDGKPGKQYLHELDNAYIPKSAVSIQIDKTLVLDSEELSRHLNRIRVEQNLN